MARRYISIYDMLITEKEARVVVSDGDSFVDKVNPFGDIDEL